MAVGAGRAKQVPSELRDSRRQARIVRAALNKRLPLYERLIFPVQIEPGFDRNRMPAVQGSSDRVMRGEAANLSSDIRIQPELS